MKAPHFVGIVIAVIFLAAGVLAPALRSGARKAADRARVQAAEARKQLGAVDVELPRLDILAEKDADRFENVVAEVAAQLEEISRAAREARERARKAGLPEPTLPSIAADVTGMRRALEAFEKAVRENQAQLNQAVQDARDAVNTDREAVGVAQVLGMGEYVRAAWALTEAEALRMDQVRAQAELLHQVADWRMAAGQAEHYRALDVQPILADLEGHLAELTALQAEADARVASLAAQVAELEQELARVEEQLDAARDTLLTIEEQGFVVGDDASFLDYRTHYLETMDVLLDLEAEHQALRYGVLRGAILRGDDLATAEVVGGEPTIGVEHLRRQLDIVRQRAARLESATQSLREQVTWVTAFNQQAQAERQRYVERTEQARGAIGGLVERVQALAAQAQEREEDALRAGQAAANAFAQAQRGADAWIRDTQTLQRERDPDRKNERLKAILNAPYLAQFGKSAEAAAQLLVGRVYALRAEVNRWLLRDLALVTQMGEGIPFDPAPYEQAAAEARDAGVQTLERALTAFDQLAQRPPTTAWVPLASLAATHHLMTRLDPTFVAEYGDRALAAIEQAVGNREKSPYVVPLVRFRDHLLAMRAGGVRPVPVTPSGPIPPATPAEDASDEGDDFFDE